jgi:hypothetical protein
MVLTKQELAMERKFAELRKKKVKMSLRPDLVDR